MSFLVLCADPHGFKLTLFLEFVALNSKMLAKAQVLEKHFTECIQAGDDMRHLFDEVPYPYPGPID